MSNRQFTVADRTYEVLSVHAGKSRISAHEMLTQGRLLKANMGKEDADFIFKNANMDSLGFKEDESIVFLEWRDGSFALCFLWTGKIWCPHCVKMITPFGLISSCHLVRRIS